MAKFELPDRLLTTREAAEYLTTTPNTLGAARTRRNGAFADLNFCKFGKAVRYKLSDLVAYVEAAMVKGGKSK